MQIDEDRLQEIEERWPFEPFGEDWEPDVEPHDFSAECFMHEVDEDTIRALNRAPEDIWWLAQRLRAALTLLDERT